MKIDIYDLAGKSKDFVRKYCDEQKKLTKDEFAELWTTCIIGSFYELLEDTKHLYNTYGQKVTQSDKYALARNQLFSYYLRSLLASDLDATHPSFGLYASAAIDNYEWDTEILIKLRTEFGERPVNADNHMPIGKSYWQC